MAQNHPVQAMQHPLHSYFERWHALKQYSDSKDDLIKELLMGWSQAASELTEENERLKQGMRELQLDLDDAIKSRRDLQIKVESRDMQIGRYVQDNDGFKNRNPYVMVLIDGDGLIFQDRWINQGIEGGKKAAYALRAAIAEYCDDHDGDVEIMAKAVANVSGLSRAMQREGNLHEGDLKDFTLGFTQAKASFDFIDVGYGKERADSKIKEMTRWNLRNHNCKQVFLGVSHDSGYAPFLDEILQDENTRKRVTVLEGFPTVRELRATGVNVHSALADTIFRKDKIPTAIGNGYGNGYVNSTNGTNGKTRREHHSPTSDSASLSSQTPPAPGLLSTASSWAVMTTKAASPPPKITTPLAHRTTSQAKVKVKEEPPAWSPGPRGADPWIKASNDAMESVKNREKNEKFCNNHFLRGPCPKRNTSCQFDHVTKPSSEQIAAIKLLTRMNPCTSGQDCYVEDCIYGHNCPLAYDGYCPNQYCRFAKELHPPGTRFANKKIDYN